MGLAPEFQILILNATVLAVAYFGIYPTLRAPTVGRVLLADAVISAAALVVAGALFAGSGQRFWTPIGDTNWAVFWLVTMVLLEMPLFTRFARRCRFPPFDQD